MKSLIANINSLVPRPARVTIVVLFALSIIGSSSVVDRVGPTIWGANMKIQGKADSCPWDRILTLYPDRQMLADLQESTRAGGHVASQDQEWGIELISLPASARSFWIRTSGERVNGQVLVPQLIAEHQWIASQDPGNVVKPGDIVIDCGAHVGVFVDQAPQRGAAKVIAVDPDPTQLECLRRNFAPEIETGQVVLVPKAVWSSPGKMSLHIGTENSGMSSLVKHRGGNEIEVDVTTIDDLVAELGLPRVDFIKFDIEGAEREALKGAMKTLTNDRPRLLIDSYHRDDDMVVLPEIIAQAHSDYRLHCGPCVKSDELEDELVVPSFVMYE